MSYPIAELAVQDALAALAGVTTANGYTFDADVEARDVRDGNPPADGLVVVEAGDPAPFPGSSPCGLEELYQPVVVTCHHCPADADPTRVTATLARMAADVRRCLSADAHRGGYAVNTEFKLRDDFRTDAAPFTVTVTAFLRVRHVRGNPYAQS